MKKNLYHLELAVKDLDLFGNPEPVQSDDGGWKHLFGTFKDAAKFVFDIVHGYTGERLQREIIKLKLTRYTEGFLNRKRKRSKGFHKYNFCIEFEEITLKDINKHKINEKTYEKFVKDLAMVWKDRFNDVDKRMTNDIKGVRKKRK